MNIINLTKKYFEYWNEHNASKVGEMFNDVSFLRDWDIFVENPVNIMKATNNIFNTFPDIKCELIKIHESKSTNSTICELLIHLNLEQHIKVVDILEFDNELKIKSLKAFKG